MIGMTDYLQQRAGHAGLGHRVRGVRAHGARHPHPHCLLHSSQNVTNITNDLYNATALIISRRKTPINYILLGAFTVCESLSLGVVRDQQLL